jgi:hypothetical protein
MFDEFEKAFKSIKKNKSIGADQVNGNVIIECFEQLKNILFKIFRASIHQGVFPEKLKIAKIIPIFKEGDKSEISNYRPISVLSTFSKIIEQIMFNRVYKYFHDNNLLYTNQFGFKKDNSAEHAIIQFVRELSKSFKKSQYTIGVFIDLAFDTVDHHILIHKLKYYGINNKTLKWFKSYLSNRKQFIPINNNHETNFLNITCGVLQGSILGPLLFLIYINDLNKASKLTIIMYADDTNLFHTNFDLIELFKTVNKELRHVSNWFKCNKLTLNTNKTKWVLFHSITKKRFLPSKLPQIFIDQNEIKRDFVTKFLGVYLDENITWNHHIDYISNKISKNMGI